MKTLATGISNRIQKIRKITARKKNLPNSSSRLSSIMACAILMLAQTVPLTPALADPSTESGSGISFEPPTIPAHELPPPPSVPAAGTIVPPEILSTLAPVQNPTYALLDISQTGEINIGGASSWVNTGNLVVYSTNPLMNTATLTAQTIINPANTSITTILPPNLNIAGAISNLNLLLNAGSIYNAGSIASAGTLTMHADVIANVAVPTAVTPPVMSAIDAVNIVSPTILNQGIIASALSNINIAGLNNSLAINALGGTFSAINGSIQLGVPEILNNVMNINVLGGDMLSKTLNINADAGLLSAKFNTVTGLVNLRAHEAYMGASEGDLRIGHQFVNGDPYEFTDGDLIFTGITDVDFLSASAANILADTSQGGVGIFSAGSINLTASGSINLSGTAIIASSGGEVTLHSNGNILLPGTQIITNGRQIALVSEEGSVVAPGVQVKSNGGRILIAGRNDVVLSDGKVSATIDSSKGTSPGGTIFITSLKGSVNLGPESIVTTGVAPATVGVGTFRIIPISITAFNGIIANDVTAVGGDIFVGSGYATQRFSGGFMVPSDGGGEGIGGISIKTVSNATGEGVGAGGLSVHATNGDLNAKNIAGNGNLMSVFSSNDIILENGITNVSEDEQGGLMEVSAFRNLELPDGIVNDSLNGEGGQVYVSAGQAQGLTVGGGGLTISNTAATNGGTVQVLNYGSLSVGSGGIIAKASNGNGSSIILAAYATEAGPSALSIGTSLDMSDASIQGNGGEIRIYAEGPLTFTGTTFSANGAGTGSGGFISIRSEFPLNAQGATLSANGGSDGSGGNIQIYANTFTGGDFNLFANGYGTGIGGNNFLSLSGSGDVSSAQIAMTATGANGGSATINSTGDLKVNTSVFNVKATSIEDGYGNGGLVWLESQTGHLAVDGNINVDAVGSGRGGTIYLRSGGSESFVLAANSKLYARGGSAGSTGGDGGRIEVRVGGDVTVNPDAVLSVAVRGTNGSGGVLSLSAGDLFGPDGPSLLTVNRSLSVNGKGNGDGGSIFLSSSGGKENSGIVLNGDLFANTGLTGALAGNVEISMDGLDGLGSITINKNISANAGEFGQGGRINIGQLGSSLQGTGTPEIKIVSTSVINALSGTTGGFGGDIKVSGAGVVNIDGQLNASSRGVGDAGTITIESNAVSAGEAEPGITVNGTLKADAGTFGLGGTIKITGDDTKVNMKSGAFVSARSGSSSGAGGEIRALSDTGIMVHETILDASARGTGDGGLVKLELREVNLQGGPVETFALQAAPLSLTANVSSTPPEIKLTASSVKANAGSHGVGGQVVIASQGTGKDINIGQITSLNANGGTQTGDGGNIKVQGDGYVSITNSTAFTNALGNGSGGTVLASAFAELDINANLQSNGNSTGTGGNITLRADNNVTLTKSHIQSRFVGDGKGGTVQIDSGKSVFLDQSELIVDSHQGVAGSVSIESGAEDLSSLVISDTLISARAINSGSGGNIYLKSTSDSGDIKLLNSSALLADGGTSSGDGGTIDIDCAGSIDLKPTVVSASARKDGNGGIASITAGQNLTIETNITANAKGEGNGGTILVTSNDGDISITGSMQTDAGSRGDGGRIDLQSKNGRIDLDNTIQNERISSRGGTIQGNGNIISLNASKNIKLMGGSLDVSAIGTGDAGSLSINGIIDDPANPTSLRAGAFRGTGGTIQLFARGDIAEIDQDLFAGVSNTGNGGNIRITSTAGLLRIRSHRISTDGAGQSGRAGTISISACVSCALDFGPLLISRVSVRTAA